MSFVILATINKRYVFNFTVKDQLNDSINVTCWGGAEFLLPIADICQIGSLGINYIGHVLTVVNMFVSSRNS